jgi:hypothetical protein
MHFFITLKVNIVVKDLLYQKSIPIIVCILPCIWFIENGVVFSYVIKETIFSLL